MYADFRSEQDYQKGLAKLLERLEPESEAPSFSPGEVALRPYLFIETSRHGYLRVPQSEIQELGIYDKITAICSLLCKGPRTGVGHVLDR